MQEVKPFEIEEQKARLKQSWEFQQQYMLQMMNDAVSWQCSSEQYDSLVRDYYIARQKHQKEVMRLNQILYSSENMSSRGYTPHIVSNIKDQVMTDRLPLQETQCFSCSGNTLSKKRSRALDDICSTDDEPFIMNKKIPRS